MKDHEEAVGIFRVCGKKIEGLGCYDEMGIDKLMRIKIKDRDYLICPKAVKFWDERDFEKYRLKN